MPIKGRSEIIRIPRVGKIHLGVKVQKDSSEYPKAVDHFIVKPDDSTSENAANAFKTVYGDKPKEIAIAFPSDDPEKFFPQYLSSYRKVGERHELFCKGDGETANRANGQGGYTEIQCEYQNCPIYQAKKCKELGMLQFFLPDVPGVGIWQVNTTSFHTTVNLNSSIQMLLALTGGKIAMLPLKLRIVPKVVNPDGKPKTVYVLSLGVEDMKLADLINKVPLLPSSPPLIEPLKTDELPEDLFVDKDMVEIIEGQDKPVKTETTIIDEPIQEGILGAVVDVQISPYRETQAGLLKVAVPVGNEDRLIEAITIDPSIVAELKALQHSQPVRFQLIDSVNFKNRKELTYVHRVS